uniref:Uncharacterized protein n=1 Tax=Jaculus jaculus TaxID=51337 RepID=A0A8C5NW72_JACJA
MVDCMFVLTWVLLISCCLPQACCSQPNCTSVTDFDDCPGNVIDFCPKTIACACKDGKPFCKCPNYRGQWENYWYMGAKCDQLWSTLDLILIATLPGIGLAVMVALIIQTVYFCNKRTQKSADYPREQRCLSVLQPQANSTYSFDDYMKLPQPNQGQFMPHELREDNYSNYPSYNWDRSQGTSKTETNYGNKHLSTRHAKSSFEFSTLEAPRSSFIQNERQYNRYSNYEEPTVPYRIGRAQMKSNNY